MPAPALKSALSAVVYAAATENTRPILTGVLFEINAAGTVHATAADGFRLATWTGERCATSEGAASVIVPAAALDRLARSLPKSGDAVMEWTNEADARIAFTCGEGDATTIIARVIPGTWPNYRQIARRDVLAHSATVLRAELLDAMKSAKATKAQRVSLATGRDCAELAVQWTGEAEDAVERIMFASGTLGRHFLINPAYLYDTLNAMTGFEVTIQSSDQNVRPIALLDPAASSIEHYIMPMYAPAEDYRRDYKVDPSTS